MTRNNRTSRSQAVRARLSHPIVDVDGHCAEFEPVLLDYLREVGGPKIVDRYKATPENPFLYRWHSLDALQRREERLPRPNWWGHPTSNTLDRATSALPRLMYERIGEMGLDFCVLYPSINLNSSHLADEEVRRAACRAFNLYQAEMFRDLSDRLTPVAVIPMHTPAEAIEELEYVADTLKLKAIVMPAYVRRPIPALARKAPDLAQQLYWLDTYCLDSDYDYDPVWAKCVELRLAPSFHSRGTGIGTRNSISNFTYNHIGHFAYSAEGICKAIFLGGVTRRFPSLRFAFQEGGIGWARGLFGDLVSHWKTRNPAAVASRNPAHLDHQMFRELALEYGGKRYADKFPVKAEDISVVMWGTPERAEDLNEWARSGVEQIEDIRDGFVPRFFFGCEGDDKLTALAFRRELNPFGAQLNAIYGSDLGHFDLPDMRDAAYEAWELVEDGVINESEFRDFVFANPVRLHGGMNPDFFKGTAIEREAAAILAETDRPTSAARK
ncbi:MAG: amidohydrolase family protein [Candidatus Binataceae bacterium]|nr:amidohydrolase family protein [Candidatus Binataceae bacterium]